MKKLYTFISIPLCIASILFEKLSIFSSLFGASLTIISILIIVTLQERKLLAYLPYIILALFGGYILLQSIS